MGVVATYPGAAMTRSRASTALVAVVAFLAVLLAPSAALAQPQSPEPSAWIVVDADTGKVLAAKEPHAARPPASTAKIMTALAAVERLAPGATVKVSELAAAQPASKINMVAGDEWQFEDALASLMMVSANDAAYAIAEATSGSLDGFAAALTSTAARYGMRDSTFADPAGFDDAASFGGGPRMSAFDIAISARNALAVPQLAFLGALPSLEFVDPQGATRQLTNHNKILPGKAAGYEGANGLKTGFTRQAGHTLVATATRDRRTLIVVILNTYDTYGWARHLFDLGFAMGPDKPGTGERLPDVRVSPFAQREADFIAFTRLATGADPVATSPAASTPDSTLEAAPVATIASAPPPTAATGEQQQSTLRDSASATAGEAAGAEESSGGSSLVRNLLVVLLLVLLVLVQLRRRAVKRQRARRLARRKATDKAMRRGALPVVDGRYRNGSGAPSAGSHVRVTPIERHHVPHPPGRQGGSA